MSTDALELALALHQAPLQRFALRDRPLPENIGVVLQLASGTQPLLEEAAAQFSESQDTVLEAVRFYLHQVLFEPGTDAYRILGLPRDADARLIRQHHVWLQRWLHPDRRGEDWEAVFTTKVNWAWQQLRTESAREEYDNTRTGTPEAEGDRVVEEAAMPIPGWGVDEFTAKRRHWPRRIAFGFLLGLCGGLFYLAATLDDRVDRDATVLPADASEPSAPNTVADAAGAPRNADAPVLTRAGFEGAPPSAAMRQDPTSASAPQSGVQDFKTGTGSASGPGDNTSSAVPMADVSVVQRTASAGDPQVASAAAIRALHIAASADDSGEKAGDAAPRRADGQQPSLRAPSRVSTDSRDASGDRAEAVARASASDAVRPAEIGEGVGASVEGDAAASAEPSAPASVTAEDSLLRFELARERLRSMVDYLRTPNVDPPDWNDASGLLTIEREHDALHARNGQVEISRFALDPPHWRLSDGTVALEANYRVDAERGVAESGRFYLDMAWRDGNWMITRMKVLPSP